MKIEKTRSGRAGRDNMVNEKNRKACKNEGFWEFYRYEQRAEAG